LRIAVASLFVLLAVVQIVSNTIINDEQWALGAGSSLWPAHPRILTLDIMGDVAKAAVRGAPPDEATLDRLQLLASEDPLSAEPYLVEAALAVKGGDYRRAEMLLLQARHLEPRSPAARFLLADLYLRTGRALMAMREMAVLNRLVPASASGLAPALAAYAREGGGLAEVRAIIDAYPELEPQLLAQLATDARNADLILSLAKPRKTPIDASWQAILLSKLVENGGYAKAYQLWTRFAGVPPQAPGLFNPDFSSSNAPPPFNWELSRGSGGVADAKGGGLEILYFGREDLVLARQLLLLAPGRYRLTMNVSGQVGDANGIRWKVICLPSKRVALDLPIRPGTVGGDFATGQGCAAQRLELAAEGEEFPERSEVRISGLKLVRAPGA
jgi:hypothetical protein